VTKDRPRNRPGKGGKSGGFGGSRGGGPDRPRSERSPDRPRREDGERPAAAGRTDKPWQKDGQRDQRPQGGPRQQGRKPGQQHHGRPERHERREAAFEENGEVWIWGQHAGAAALANPMRKISTALMTRNAAVRSGLDPEALPRFASLIEARELDERLPPGAVHQGLAVRCRPLEGIDIADAAIRPEKPLAILDQVTDPQNVGAIFRSAAAFGVAGIVMQTRNAPTAGGALAKAATGAIETVEEIRAVNISRAIDALTDAGWTVIGLDGAAEMTLEQAVAVDGPVAIVLGAEGAGIRQGVANACSVLARIPMQPGMESLNVSNAAAIAFYELARRKPAPPAAAKRRQDDDETSGFAGEDE
jgi:23S rRNA (guanosine2251-2'-O)-methyltransferase